MELLSDYYNITNINQIENKILTIDPNILLYPTLKSMKYYGEPLNINHIEPEFQHINKDGRILSLIAERTLPYFLPNFEISNKYKEENPTFDVPAQADICGNINNEFIDIKVSSTGGFDCREKISTVGSGQNKMTPETKIQNQLDHLKNNIKYNMWYFLILILENELRICTINYIKLIELTNTTGFNYDQLCNLENINQIPKHEYKSFENLFKIPKNIDMTTKLFDYKQSITKNPATKKTVTKKTVTKKTVTKKTKNDTLSTMFK